MKKILAVLLVASWTLLLQTGCVVGRRTVSLPIPSVTGSTAATKGEVYLGEVTDRRIFENKPNQPSTPSVDGDATVLSAAQRDSMIGRQRNGYGGAMGDIALPAGESVTQRVRLLVAEGLKARGYSVGTDPAAPNSASVTIDQFWAWFSPGFATVSFEARVYCTLTLKQGDKSSTVVVQGYGLNKGQVASDANWQLAYDRAFRDFLVKLGPELEKAGF